MALLPVAAALDQILAGVVPLDACQVALNAALGRTLAQDLKAQRTQPPSAVSAMDGYALRAADVAKTPAQLKIIGEVAAGHPFDGAVGPGEAARIFTGGVLPEGADAVVIQENTARDGNSVTVQRSVAAGKNIRPAGIDFRQGEILLAKGRRLNDRDLMLAAAMNFASVPVHREPAIAILGTGDELVMPGGAPSPAQIVYSNGFSLAALAQYEGASVQDFGIAKDRVDDIAAAVRRAKEAKVDILLTSGGASVGEHDLVQQALASEGLALSFWRVALRPGRPMMHGRLGPMHVLGVPGNPVSSYVCAFLFLVPLIRKLSGRSDFLSASTSARLGVALEENDERADYLRATVTPGPDGVPIATPLPVQDSSLMATLSRADCLLIREPHAPAAPVGSRCVILKFGL